MSRFIIQKDYFTTVKKFNVRGHKIDFKIKPIPKNIEPIKWVKDAIEDIIHHATNHLEPTDYVGVTFCGESFKDRGPGWINYKEAKSITFKDIWGMISKIFQSNSKGLATDTFCLGITSVRLPSGKGRGNNYNSFNEECAMRRGIVTIDNTDHLCLPRAVVTAIAQVTNNSDYQKIRKNTCKLQTVKVMELLKESNIIIPLEGGGIPELNQFQKFLKDYKITVYNYGSKGKEVMFEGNVDYKHKINLLHHKNHYNVITSITAAFCCSYYCDSCHISYNTKNKHRCGGTCACCQQTPVCTRVAREIECTDCNRSFRGQTCFDNHKAESSLRSQNICSLVKKCLECLKTYQGQNQHVCGEIYCKNCAKHVAQDHLCYIQPNSRKPVIEKTLFIFFDLETRQEKILRGTTDALHEPNLCVFIQCCDKCIDKNTNQCEICGIRQQILKIRPIEVFIQYILNQRKLFKKVICIAHNGQAFDHQFILNYIIEKTDIKPDIIQRGTKILLLQLKNVKFIDSLNYFPMSLSKMPKAFNLSPTFKKGYFPYLFNTKENEYYVGPLPSLEYYNADMMKGTDDNFEDDRKIFLEWYENHKNDTFDMQRDLVDYCVNDVNILMQACLKFREDFINECNVCPFTEAITIASACNLVYRRNFLKPNTIGIIPKNGYRWRDNQSEIAIQWLLWEEKQRNINIIHAAKQKESVLNGVKVDGYCEETKQIFEFHGCYFHGHPKCLKYRRDDKLSNDDFDTLNNRYEATQSKSQRLRAFGYEVIEKWECEFRDELMQNGEMEYIKTHPLLHNAPLKPRDAFYGGRTGNTKMYYKAKEGEKIKYIDICSLYPWVCKNGKFPIDHPKVYCGDEECRKLDITKTNGLIKCTILPPQNLYHPVLPIKQNNKLMFVLCCKCGDQLNQNECDHNESERALFGTWVIDEVLKALEKGYRLLEINEIWSYKTEQHDSIKRYGGLFTAMMNKFIKLKQTASGFPSNCLTQEEKDNYIEEFLNSEGIQLEFSEIVKNEGLRSLAKLMLNSFWGKFGQRENQPKTSIIKKPDEFYELITNATININHIMPVNEDTLIVNWEHKEEAMEPLAIVNVCIAAYTTAQARLKLYEYLENLGDRVLYYDTDSVIYVSVDGKFEPPTGNCIGDMTDELNEYGVGSYITEFVSGGPKNYAFKIWSTKNNTEIVICKVKGINLNYNASKLVNFESIKNMILSETEEPIAITSDNIRRTADHKVITKTETKTYQIKAEKRVFMENYDSVPYGFKRSKY